MCLVYIGTRDIPGILITRPKAIYVKFVWEINLNLDRNLFMFVYATPRISKVYLLGGDTVLSLVQFSDDSRKSEMIVKYVLGDT